ncbi:MAG: DNA mismatch repair endonuclease MutL [Xenococcaceae cyanobacterium]
MSSEIETLPPEVVNVIAAGEVIDSLAAVVRELIENALDAGATRIAICLWTQLWRISVADNGKGMSLRDLRVCAKAHSTSKIRTSKDLWKITSLGFRGEALHSISQVADLEILSRSSSVDTVGWHVIYREGKAIEEITTAIAPGTIVNVTNLFGNLPVRRKGLPSMSQQLKTVQGIIHQIALTHPNVTWQIEQNDRLWFSISPSEQIGNIVPQILKQVKISDLQCLKLEIPLTEDAPIASSQSQIELVIGLPDRTHRRRADWIKVAVNGRMVKVPELEQTILSAFVRTLPRDRYPVCFIHLHICPSQIDWNRHPAKTEIYLHSCQFWQERVTEAIEQALRLSASHLPTFDNRRLGKILKASEEKGKYDLDRQNIASETPKGSKFKHSEIGLIELKAIAQANNTYIVAEHPNGIWLVEQHIAHERILYEQLQDAWQLIPLETPIVLNNLNSIQREQLLRIGIEVEPFGEQVWAVRIAPAMLADRDDRADALVELSWGGDLQQAQVATACRSAIRNGTPLSLPEMQNLLDRWKNTRNPRTCPHGRPIYLALEEFSLARFFRRHWVIGKSHGI